MSDPRQAFSIAIAHHRAGRLEEAEKLYEEILSQVPNQADSLHLLGVVATQRRDFKAAIKLINRAIKQKKAVPVAEFHNNIGAAHKGLGQNKDAAHHFRTAARLKPDYAEAFNNLGSVQESEGEFGDAKKNYQQALTLKPDYAKALCGLGNIAAAQDDPAGAVEFYEQAVALDLGSVEARSNLGKALIDLNRVDDAEAQLRQALAVNAKHAPAHYNLGIVLEERGDFSGAGKAYQEALRLSPDDPDYHWNAGLLALLKGSFVDGWQEYEWRLRRGRKLTREVKKSRWDGSDPAGQTILIQTEQGFGDTFQFIRYAQVLKDRGAKIVVECQPKTERLIPLAAGVDSVIHRDENLPKVDKYIQLLSLPYLFSTSLESVPAHVPYLTAPTELAEEWRDRLSTASGLKAGLVWRGNPLNTINPKKSIPINGVADLCSVKGVNWFSIQLDADQDELGALQARTPIEECGPLLTDWAETAALVSALDIVITIDTGVAHLAGALGKPVLILLSHIPDWRWMLERSDSPWYPTARLYRQPAIGDWASPLGQVRSDLEKQVQNSR